MAPIFGLILLLLSCFEQSGKTVVAVDVIHSVSHQTAPVSAVHWPSIVGDDRSHRTNGPDGRLERSLFGSSSSSSGNGICSEQSEISENTIIRTKDSRALGARFLNETSLGADARDRCINLCCSFHGCNVAVYEEKDGGNCYLFDCGPAEDFRCKFTSHSHYTSGVIRRRENAHEEELTQLKKISVTTVTTVVPIVTEAITNPPTVPPSTAARPVRTCSRYQFECHTTGECIAIYNACDGIIQCSDGSDEAPELGCPATTTETPTTRALPVTQTAFNTKQAPVDIQQNSAIAQHPPLDWRAGRGRDRYNDRDQVAPIDLPPNGEANHWRTMPENTRTYAAERLHAPYQIGVNGEAAPYPIEPDRSVNPYYNPDMNHRYGSAWREQQDQTNNLNDYRPVENAYGDRYYDKDARVPYNINNNAYPSAHKHDWDRKNAVIVNSSPPQQSLESRPIQSMVRTPESERSMGNTGGSPPNSVNQPTVDVSTPKGQKIIEVPDQSTTSKPMVMETSTAIPTKIKPPSLVTKPTVSVNHAHIHHFGVNQATFQEEKAERTRQTVGAAWALTLGLSVTAVLVLLVGCRLRSLKRHLRGRGRGGHARDADYLVNGMYL